MKIRSDIIRTYQSIHTWTGIIAGLFLFIGFYAGSLTMFKPAIEQWATPSSYVFEQVLPTQRDNIIHQAIERFEPVKQGFILNFDEQSSFMQWYAKGGGRGLRLDDELVHARLNEHGDIITEQAVSNKLGSLIDQLHRSAGIVGKLGHEDVGVLVLGLAAALYFLAIISGVIFLLPSLVRSLFALRTNKGASRFWLDSHNLIGIVSLPFHIVIAWTAVVFAFHDPFYGGLSVVYGDEPMFERRAASSQVYDIATLPSVQAYLDKVAELAPDHQLKSLEFSQLSSANPSVAIEVQSQTQMMRGGYSDFIYMNPYTFDVEYSSVFNENSGVYGPIVSSFFGLHFGNYAGDFGRWVYFLLGLLGAFLFYSGNLLWLDKRRKKQGEQTRSTRVMAALTVGVCLGSILGVVVSLLLNKWVYFASEQVNNAYLVGYYSVFFLAIFYCFKQGAAKGAIHLQFTMVVALLAIPLTTMLFALAPSLSEVYQFQQTHYFIELIATCFAVLFYVSGSKTRKRALMGEENSVWSLPVNHQSNVANSSLTLS